MYKELWRERQSEQEPHLISMEFPWKKRLPLKIKFFLWTAYLNRILTNCNLIKRGRAVDPICSACILSNEDVTHLFLHCSKTLEVWEHLLRPRDSFYANIFAADSIEEWINAWPCLKFKVRNNIYEGSVGTVEFFSRKRRWWRQLLQRSKERFGTGWGFGRGGITTGSKICFSTGRCFWRYLSKSYLLFGFICNKALPCSDGDKLYSMLY
ncbi:hypothetical protein FRX31_016516 [Thalictrum thalictroides]|uniref:Reverse transcriptase zinc-binding domain-containing protein n=1 Tax=Thalictrum thalictroides TaxID=46969 RepID=A0A7J6W8X4_THATH|nr:hypothetical protein FRX31_016516 [Thalictrum thalictroides]